MAEEKILTRVRKLLDKANDVSIPEVERQLFLDKADELMIKHAIDEALLMSKMSKEDRRKPINERFRAADENAPHWEKFRTVLRYIARLYHVRSAFYGNSGDVHLVGYFEDVEYVKMKFLNVYLHFSKTIDPRWDKSLTPEHNVYNFKVAGQRWDDIQYAAAMNGVDKPLHWFKPAYRRHCRFIGEEPTRHTQRNFAYRESFAEAFRTRICERIEELMRDRDKATEDAGALVAVKDLGAEVDEMYWSLFPHLRPETAEQRAEREARMAEWERQEQLRKEQHERLLESLSPEERKAYDREQEAEKREQARRDRDYWRQQSKLFDSDGHKGGAASADKVDLSRNEGINTSFTKKEL